MTTEQKPWMSAIKQTLETGNKGAGTLDVCNKIAETFNVGDKG